jgi:hypothetical protein
MFVRSFVVAMGLSLTLGAQQSWRTPGACLTPNGTPCRTLTFESSGWENRSWGFHAVDRYADRTIAAVRSDGSALLRIAHRGFKYHLIPSGSYDRTRVVLPAKRETFEIEHSLKETRELGGVWSFADYWTDETDCNERATMAGARWRRTSNNLTVAGERAIEYLYETPDHRIVQRIAFAPSLGCSAVEYRLSQRNAAGLPISENYLKLVSATLGEPEAVLFAIPSDYRKVRDEQLWPYVWMDKFPGSITTTGFSSVVP